MTDIHIAGEATVIGPDEVLIIAMPAGEYDHDNADRLSALLTERLGDRFIVLWTDDAAIWKGQRTPACSDSMGSR